MLTRNFPTPFVAMQLPSLIKKILVFIGLALVLCAVTLVVAGPLMLAQDSLRGIASWLNADVATTLAMLPAMLACLFLLQRLERAPDWSTLLAPHWRSTLGLSLGVVAMAIVFAASANPQAFLDGHMTSVGAAALRSPQWTLLWIPLTIGIVIGDGFSRAIWQSLWTSCFGPWVGVLSSGLMFIWVRTDIAIALPSALLIAVVFMRTRSIVSTAILSLALQLSREFFTSASFTGLALLPPKLQTYVAPLHGVSLLVLALVFDLRWRARRADVDPPNERAAIGAVEPTSV